MQINRYQVDDGKTEGCWYDSNGQFIGDGRTKLYSADDAAHANWGGLWVTPTEEDFRELRNNTTKEWTTENGVKGVRYTSTKNGNSIFLPAAGVALHQFNETHNEGVTGYYWSASLDKTDTLYAKYFYSSSTEWSVMGACRYYGHSIRPVIRY